MPDFELRQPPTPKKTKTPLSEVVTEASPAATNTAPSIKPVDSTEDTATTPARKFDQEKLLRIFDEILFNGEYAEEHVIKGRLKITLRSRSTGDMGAITNKMDDHIKNAGTVISVAQKNSLLNMCYSLVKYNGKDLSTLDPLTTRLAFIEKIPAPIMDAMISCLSKFDEEITEACKEGEENF